MQYGRLCFFEDIEVVEDKIVKAREKDEKDETTLLGRNWEWHQWSPIGGDNSTIGHLEVDPYDGPQGLKVELATDKNFLRDWFHNQINMQHHQ